MRNGDPDRDGKGGAVQDQGRVPKNKDSNAFKRDAQGCQPGLDAARDTSVMIRTARSIARSQRAPDEGGACTVQGQDNDVTRVVASIEPRSTHEARKKLRSSSE